jgi:hypothetical protein
MSAVGNGVTDDMVAIQVAINTGISQSSSSRNVK